MLDGVTGVLLAGGRGTRMGGQDKGLLQLDGKPLIAHGVQRLRPQVAELLISANRHQESYSGFNCRIINDPPQVRFRGPLAGMLAAMNVAQTAYILTAPCDSPYLAPHYAQRMWEGLGSNSTKLSVALHAANWQPVFTLLSVELRDNLAAYLAGNQGGVQRWLRTLHPTLVTFDDCPEMFANFNTPEALANAARGGDR